MLKARIFRRRFLVGPDRRLQSLRPAAGPVFDHHVEAPGIADAHDGRWRDDHEFAFGDFAESPVEFVHDGVLVQFGAAFRPAFEDHEGRHRIGQGRAFQHGKTADGDPCFHAGRVGEHLIHTARQFRSARAGRGVGQLRAHKDIPLILFGQEALRQGYQPPDGKGGEDAVRQQGDGGRAQGDPHNAHGKAVQGVVPAVEDPAKDIARRHVGLVFRKIGPFALRGVERGRAHGFLLAEQQGTFRGRERDGENGAEECRAAYDQRELAVQLPGDAGERGRREEYAGKDEHHRHDGEEQIPHAREGGFLRRQPPLQMGHGGFHNDDRVVHDEPYRQHEREKRYHVYRKTGDVQENERPHEGHGNDHRRADRRPEVLEEDQHDQHDQHNGFHKGQIYLRHGDGNEVRRVERHGPAHVGREILGQFFHGAADVGGGFKGVGVGQLVDGDERRVVPADLGLCPVGLRPHFDFAHVAQPDYLVAGQRLDNDVAECRGRVQLPLHEHRQLHGLLVGIGPAADVARGYLNVLLADGLIDLVHAHAKVVELVEIQPDPHGVEPGPESLHLPDPLHAGKDVFDLQVRVVGQKKVVVGAAGGIEGYDLQDGGGVFGDRDPLLLYDLRQQRERVVDQVLQQYHGDIDIGPQREGDGEGIGAVIGAGGGHVDHVFHAVDLQLYGRADGLGHGFCVRAGIAGGNGDRRRGDVGIQRYGKARQRHDAQNDRNDGNDVGKNGILDEQACKHRTFLILRGRCR